MQRVSGLLALLVLVFSGPGMGCTAGPDMTSPSSAKEGQARRVFPAVAASQVWKTTVTVPAQSAIEVALRGRSSIRSKIHLWDPETAVELARGAQFVHWNRADRARTLQLIGIGTGVSDLLVNGVVRPITLGGTKLTVPGGPGYRYHVVAGPTEASATGLVGLDVTGRIVAVATAGVLASDHVAELLVSGTGSLRVYVNDPDDADGDGLGAALEASLGTCDAPAQAHCRSGPLARYYRSVEAGTRDSDRDGLDDALELLGQGALDLPRWGADPRHKDVFVELDHVRRLGHVGVTEADLDAVATLYAEGSAEALFNPDGLPGVRLHFDVGFEPKEPRHRGLFGDWGGSNAVSSARHARMRTQHMRPERKGLFRYALATSDGTGQATGDSFAFNYHFHRARVLSHELGHTLGLDHYGHAAWGKANCKPHYLSIMNYLYQNDASVGFARGQAPVFDPGNMMERGTRGALSAERLRASPLELDVFGDDVDWNRDGVISDQPVRAPLTTATFKSCGEPASSRSDVWHGAYGRGRPVLLRVGAFLHAIFVDASGALLWTRAAVRDAEYPEGPCPEGDDLGSRCTRFDAVQPLATPAPLAFVAGTVVDGQAWLALVGTDGELSLTRLLQMDASPPRLADPTRIAGASTDAQPALALQAVDGARLGADSLLGIFYRRPDGALWTLQVALDGLQTRLAPVLDGRGDPIHTGLAPAVLALGTGETCGVFADQDRFLRFYCYAPERDLWQDLSQDAFYEGLGPRSEGPPALAYHRYRSADGASLPGDRGAVYLAFQVEETRFEPRAAQWLVSESLGATGGARARIHFRYRGRITDQWSSLAEGAGVALYEDRRGPSLHALLPRFPHRAERTTLQFVPFADGSYHGALTAGDDFQVMERGICLGLHGPARCGGPETAHY